MPNQKELRWSQLKVGILTLVALTVLIGLIFLMSSSTGGLFTSKLKLRAYFENASGLKVGAPVTLAGYTVGNVTSVRILPHHEPDPVEVEMSVGSKFLPALHTDSTISMAQAGLLGDAFLDISSAKATGPEPANGATLTVTATPGLSDVIRTSQESIASINQVVHKVGVLMDTLNSEKGTAGMLINDKSMAQKIFATVNQLQAVTEKISKGQGSLGKMIMDDQLYDKANSTIDKLNNIATRLDNGEGTAGKLLKDENLYRNLNTAIANVNVLLEGINSGKGTLGKLAKDPALAAKLEESIGHLNDVLKGMNEGKGTLGQLVVNRALYDDLDKTLNTASDLVTAIRQDPKKYFVIRLKVL